jgi:hypothetical protein
MAYKNYHEALFFLNHINYKIFDKLLGKIIPSFKIAISNHADISCGYCFNKKKLFNKGNF